MINGTLDLAQIEAGKLRIEPVPCDPGRIATEVAEMMKVRADSKALPLIVEHATPIPPLIQTDPVRLRQILINLVANAITYTESGSVRNRIGVHREPIGPPMLCFEVTDTGVGLSPEDRVALPTVSSAPRLPAEATPRERTRAGDQPQIVRGPGGSDLRE